MVQAVGELGYFHVLLDLLLLPHTNNALHLVCTCIDRVVASTSDESQPRCARRCWATPSCHPASSLSLRAGC